MPLLLSAFLAARQPAANGLPIYVKTATERKALTGLVANTVVFERGAKGVFTLTVNNGDTAGNTKTATVAFFQAIVPGSDYGAYASAIQPNFTGTSSTSSNIGYANGSSAAVIAAAINSWINTNKSTLLTSTVSGNVVTITCVHYGATGGFNFIPGSHTGFITAATLQVGIGLGDTYVLTDIANVANDAGWTLTDSTHRNVFINPASASILPLSVYISQIDNLMDASNDIIFSSSGTTHIGSTLLANNLINQVSRRGGYMGANLSGCPMNYTEVSAILSVFNSVADSAGASSGYLNISGVGMAPIPAAVDAAAQVDGKLTVDFGTIDYGSLMAAYVGYLEGSLELDFSALDVAGVISGGLDVDGGSVPSNSFAMTFSPFIAFSGSSFDGSTATIGVSDSPTPDSIVDWIVANCSGIPVAATKSATNRLFYSYLDSALFPAPHFTAGSAGITESNYVAGTAEVTQNFTIGTMPVDSNTGSSITFSVDNGRNDVIFDGFELIVGIKGSPSPSALAAAVASSSMPSTASGNTFTYTYSNAADLPITLPTFTFGITVGGVVGAPASPEVPDSSILNISSHGISVTWNRPDGSTGST